MCMGICIDVPDMLLAAGVGGFHAGPLTTSGPKAQSGNPMIVQVYQGADDPGITQESRTAFTVHTPSKHPIACHSSVMRRFALLQALPAEASRAELIM